MKPKKSRPTSPDGIGRRSLLRSLRGVALMLTARGFFPPLVRASVPDPSSGGDVIDEALDLLGRYGPEYGNGLSNHAPMACEALVALGRPETVLPWIGRYKGRLREPPGRQDAIRVDAWREALGDVRRVGDWIAFFEQALAEAPWKKVGSSR